MDGDVLALRGARLHAGAVFRRQQLRHVGGLLFALEQIEGKRRAFHFGKLGALGLWRGFGGRLGFGDAVFSGRCVFAGGRLASGGRIRFFRLLGRGFAGLGGLRGHGHGLYCFIAFAGLLEHAEHMMAVFTDHMPLGFDQGYAAVALRLAAIRTVDFDFVHSA